VRRVTEKVVFPPSIWAATAPARTPATPLQESIEADVAIIGGGFSGLSTALHLARRGRRAVVLEGAEVGWGASGRNNGQVIPTLSAVEPDSIVQRFGAAGERLVHLIRDSAAITFDLIREESIACEAEQSGWFQPAHSPGRIKLSQTRVQAWRRHGATAEFLDGEQTRELIGSDAWYGGMLNPTGGHINPLALARGLAGACEAKGVTIYENSPVSAYQRKGDAWTLTTPQGVVRSSSVVLATQSYTDVLSRTLAPRIARTIIPILSWQVATEPLSDNLRAKIVPGRQAVSDTRADLRFLRYDARNRLITGGALISSSNAESKLQALVGARMAETFPELGVPRLTHIWSGNIAVTPDRWPKFHMLGPNMWSWIGCNGRGVALAIATGREIAAAIDGIDVEDLALPLTEPKPIALQAIGRRIAPYVLAWYRRKDRVEPSI
jgi:glycine/D-amino acid oxidase-like deaminating enzyme